MSKIIIRKDIPVPDMRRGAHRRVDFPFGQIKPNSKESFFVPFMSRNAKSLRGSVYATFRRDGYKDKGLSLVTSAAKETIDGRDVEGLRFWITDEATASKRNPFIKKDAPADTTEAL